METKSKAIIADASALVSLVDSHDTNHTRAVEEGQQYLSSTSQPIVLPTETLAETINILGKKFGRALAVEAVRSFLQPASQFLVVSTELNDIERALDLFSNIKQSVSFTDCIVMAVADRYGTKDIFGFDKQFEDAGYNLMRPAAKRAA